MNWTARLVGWAAFAAAGPLLLLAADPIPFLSDSQLVFTAIHALAATGLGLVMGLAGQASLGHAAFYGIGAYATAILTVERNWSPWLAMAAGAGIAGIVAAAVARSVFRAVEHFLAMATLAFGLIFVFAVQHFDEFTGGNGGRGGIAKLSVLDIELDDAGRMFLFAWALVIVGVLLARNLVASRAGRALRALGESPIAAGCCGVNVVRFKIAVFVVAGVYGAVAGSLYAHHVTYVSPEEFGLQRSIELLIVVVVGGLTSPWGAVVGAFALLFVTEASREVIPRFVEGVTGPYELTVYGLLLVIVLIAFRRGLAGTVAHLWRSRQLIAVERAAERLETAPAGGPAAGPAASEAGR